VEEDVQSIRRGRAKNDPLNDAKEINITPLDKGPGSEQEHELM
jgi:hypothetical protein